MFGAFVLTMAIFFTLMVLWKRLMLFVLAAASFWIAFVGYLIATYAADTNMQLIVGGMAAVIGGLALYGLRVDGNGSNGFQRFLSRMNNDKYEMPRSGRESTEEYRERVYKALHPNRIKR
jgi:hypothetical protein